MPMERASIRCADNVEKLMARYFKKTRKHILFGLRHESDLSESLVRRFLKAWRSRKLA
jgi:hypothetical protein